MVLHKTEGGDGGTPVASHTFLHRRCWPRPLKVTRAHLSLDRWGNRPGRRDSHVYLYGRGAPWNTLHQLQDRPAQPASGPQTGGKQAAQRPGGLLGCPPTWPSQCAEGARRAGRQPLRAGPSLCLLAPTAPSPTTLFPAHPGPSDGSDVTANNLDFNQEITHPPPCPTYGLTEEKTQNVAPRAGPKPCPPVPTVLSNFPSSLQHPQEKGVRGTDRWVTPCRHTALGQACAPGILSESWGGRGGGLVRKLGHGQGRGAAPGSSASNPYPGVPMATVPLAPWKTQGQIGHCPGEERAPDSSGWTGRCTQMGYGIVPAPSNPNTSSYFSASHSCQGSWPHWMETSGGWGPLPAPVSHCGPLVDGPRPWTLGRFQLPRAGSGAPHGPSPGPKVAVSSGQRKPHRARSQRPLKGRARAYRFPGIRTPSPSLCHSKNQVQINVVFMLVSCGSHSI